MWSYSLSSLVLDYLGTEDLAKRAPETKPLRTQQESKRSQTTAKTSLPFQSFAEEDAIPMASKKLNHIAQQRIEAVQLLVSTEKIGNRTFQQVATDDKHTPWENYLTITQSLNASIVRRLAAHLPSQIRLQFSEMQIATLIDIHCELDKTSAKATLIAIIRKPMLLETQLDKTAQLQLLLSARQYILNLDVDWMLQEYLNRAITLSLHHQHEPLLEALLTFPNGRLRFPVAGQTIVPCLATSKPEILELVHSRIPQVLDVVDEAKEFNLFLSTAHHRKRIDLMKRRVEQQANLNSVLAPYYAEHPARIDYTSLFHYACRHFALATSDPHRELFHSILERPDCRDFLISESFAAERAVHMRYAVRTFRYANLVAHERNVFGEKRLPWLQIILQRYPNILGHFLQAFPDLLQYRSPEGLTLVAMAMQEKNTPLAQELMQANAALSAPHGSNSLIHFWLKHVELQARDSDEKKAQPADSVSDFFKFFIQFLHEHQLTLFTKHPELYEVAHDLMSSKRFLPHLQYCVKKFPELLQIRRDGLLPSQTALKCENTTSFHWLASEQKLSSPDQHIAVQIVLRHDRLSAAHLKTLSLLRPLPPAVRKLVSTHHIEVDWDKELKFAMKMGKWDLAFDLISQGAHPQLPPASSPFGKLFLNFENKKRFFAEEFKKIEPNKPLPARIIAFLQQHREPKESLPPKQIKIIEHLKGIFQQKPTLCVYEIREVFAKLIKELLNSNLQQSTPAQLMILQKLLFLQQDVLAPCTKQSAELKMK
jgi:hypothetical protein